MKWIIAKQQRKSIIQRASYWEDKQNEQVFSKTEKKETKTIITKIINEGETSFLSTEVKRILKEYYEEMNTKTFDNSDEMDKFIERPKQWNWLKKERKTWIDI